ncbi:MAG: hypothetical protein C4518_06450 [Desulfobacteraceae bacterium]|nr:MAG: hypothetical protein C4518_06450 [Desulfobacteraceae bacterium]
MNAHSLSGIPDSEWAFIFSKHYLFLSHRNFLVLVRLLDRLKPLFCRQKAGSYSISKSNVL